MLVGFEAFMMFFLYAQYAARVVPFPIGKWSLERYTKYVIIDWYWTQFLITFLYLCLQEEKKIAILHFQQHKHWRNQHQLQKRCSFPTRIKFELCSCYSFLHGFPSQRAFHAYSLLLKTTSKVAKEKWQLENLKNNLFKHFIIYYAKYFNGIIWTKLNHIEKNFYLPSIQLILSSCFLSILFNFPCFLFNQVFNCIQIIIL